MTIQTVSIPADLVSALLPEAIMPEGDLLSVVCTASAQLIVLLRTEGFKMERGTWCLRTLRWISWQRLGPASDEGIPT